MPPSRAHQQKLYDQLLEFFASAIFQMPVLNFIDQNCMIFCSDSDDNHEYREVHLQYKALVSALIGAFCDDSKMKYEDFVSTLSHFSERAKGFEGTALKAVYEQVLAAENYSLFVNLMLRHNVELQQQCLLLILREIGNLPPSVIAAATGASVETLQALVATAQSGQAATPVSGGAAGGGGTGAGGAGAGGGKPKGDAPSDQELAILLAVLKDSNINDSPKGGQTKSSEKQAPPSSSSAAAPPPTSTGSKASGGGGGALGPLPPVPGSSQETANNQTAEKVVDLVEQMAGKKAGYDKKVEEAMMAEASAGPSTNQPAASSGGGNSTLPPLPGAGTSSGTSSSLLLGPVAGGRGGQGNDGASLADISSMLQPLANDGKSHYGDSADMLKNPATQRALEALKNMNADDLVARSEYLKSQRDRLLTLKQQQRKNVLNEEAKRSSRPKSARMSKQLVNDDAAPGSGLSAEDEERLRIRRSIGDAIKQELMASKANEGKK